MSSGAERRTPRQERARSTVDAILEATARLVDEVGLGEATTTRIARVAGVSVGSLYQYFPGKEAIFGALIDRAAEADVARVERAVDEAAALPLAAGLRHVLRAGFDLPLARPKLFAFILRYLPELGRLPAARRLEAGVARALTRFFDRREDELPPIDRELVVLAGIGAVRGALEIVARERPEWLADDRMLEFATDLVVRYLAGAAAEHGAGSET
jgi:AcrR family transcriptional regulator